MQYHTLCPTCLTHDTGSRLAARTHADEHNRERHGGKDMAKVVGPTALSMQEFLGYVNCNYGREDYIRIHEWVIETDPLG